jgi:hypothetical protein
MFLFQEMSSPSLAPSQAPVQCLPGIKWLGCETDNSPPFSVDVTNEWSYTSSARPVCFNGVDRDRVHVRFIILNSDTRCQTDETVSQKK